MNDRSIGGPIDFLGERLKRDPEAAAIIWRGTAYSRADISKLIAREYERITDAGIMAGDTVVLKGNDSPVAIVLLLALIWRKAITVPLLPNTIEHNPGLIDIADPSYIIVVNDDGTVTHSAREAVSDYPYYEELRRRDAPGLVLFTSGSSGEPKGVVHDFGLLLEKFHIERKAMVSLSFLLFDHWGGLNTLLHCLTNGSPLVLPGTRSPAHVCELIEKHRIELLPATPTFLNMILISHAYEQFDLSSLKLITYGAEPMPSSTLKGLRRAFPKLEMRQTYGLIELGVLRAKSKDSDSLWVKLGGEGYDLRVVDNSLQIKATSAMLGYLNAPSPFTDDGYFMTGDRVEVDGDYFRILGRESELINVGGEKVYPAEVEAVVLECDFVDDVVVYGEANPLVGRMVCADIRMAEDIDEKAARTQIKTLCTKRLERFKVPVKINFVNEDFHGDRFKRMRRR